MRTEEEMFHSIISAAEADERVLAVYLKGSRTNPNVPKDIYQDFDIVYVVKETESFRRDLSWLDRFGTVILKQEQDDDFGYGDRFGLRSQYDQAYSWLLLFDDGNRIDIGVETVEFMKKESNRNKLFLPLLDKTGCLPKLPPPTDEDFHVSKPSEKQYLGCCNEFFWSLCDVAKGIFRKSMSADSGNIWNYLEKHEAIIVGRGSLTAYDDIVSGRVNVCYEDRQYIHAHRYGYGRHRKERVQHVPGGQAVMIRQAGGVLESVSVGVDFHTKMRRNNGTAYATEHAGIALKGINKEQLHIGDVFVIRNAGNRR